MEGARVLLEHEPRVITADLAGNDVRDIAAPAARAGDGVDERQGLLGQGDVRADETHDVTPNVKFIHIP